MARAALLSELVRARMLRTFNVANPVASAEWSTVVPGGILWELVSVRFQLATSATVATRIPYLRVRDLDGVENARYVPGTTQAASLTNVFTAAMGLPDSTQTGVATTALPTPAKLLLPGWTLDTVTTALQVGDQYSGIVLSVREWSAWHVQMFSELEWEQAEWQPIAP